MSFVEDCTRALERRELSVSGNANGQPFTRMLPITIAEEQQDPGM